MSDTAVEYDGAKAGITGTMYRALTGKGNSALEMKVESRRASVEC